MSDDSPVRMNVLHPLPLARAEDGTRHVFVRNFVTDAHIGAYDSEKGQSQKVRINADLTVEEGAGEHSDQLENVVCYHSVVRGIETIISSGHIHLVETLAEKVADMVLLDSRVRAVRVRVEKLDAIADAESVGIEIERHRPNR